MTDLPNKPWFRIGEAARLLGVHGNTVRNWIERGYLPARRDPSGERRISYQVLCDYLQSLTKLA